MKRLIMVAMSVLMLFFTGCGSDVSLILPLPIIIPINTVTAPDITSPQFSLDTYNFYVNGSIDYYAPDCDLDTITVSVTNSLGVVVQRMDTLLTGVAGRSTGTISFYIDYLNYRPDNYTFTIYVTDIAGYMSNMVYGSFRVYL